MGYSNSGKIQRAHLRQQAIGHEFVKTPTFTESLKTSFEETRSTELFTSDLNMRDRFLSPGIEQIESLHRQGQIPEEVWKSHAKKVTYGKSGLVKLTTDWEALAEYTNENLGTSLNMSETYMHETMRAESEERRKILANVEGASHFATFLGTGGAMLTDPVQVAAMLTPMGTMRFGATTLRTVAKMAFKEGMINVGIESVNQMNIARFKEKIGMEYHISEGGANLLAAFVFGGAIGGGRAGYRIKTGDASVAHAVEANKVIIDQVEASGPLEPIHRMVLDDLKVTNGYMEELAKRPGMSTRSARDGYQLAWKAFEGLDAEDFVPANVGSAAATEHVDTAAPVTKGKHPGEDFVSDMPDDTPIRVFDEEGGTPEVSTIGEVMAEAEAMVTERKTTYDSFMECMRG